MDIPERINNLPNEHAIEVVWSETHRWKYPCQYLRQECMCAGCVHEITGERLLDPATVPTDLVAQEMRLVGNYAIKFVWSDGHSNGIYTWERLAVLCRCPHCSGRE